MKAYSPTFYLIIFVLSVAVSVYSEKHGFDKGIRVATTALEPHLCK